MRLLGPTDAEDVIHDVFLALPMTLSTYEERGSLAAWLRRITARAALMRMRAERRRREAPLEDQHGVAPEWTDPDLERAIQRLPDSLRSVIVLHAVEGFAHREIAGILGLSAVAVRVRYMRAVRALRRELKG